MKEFKKILIIKLRAIGDVVMSTPVIENIRANFPDSHITFLTEPASHDVIRGNPYLDDLVILDKSRWLAMPLFKRLKAQWSFYKKLRLNRFDLVLDLFGNPRSAVLSLITGSPCRVGFDFRVRRFCYDTIVTPRGGEVHEVEFNLDALRALGLAVRTTNPYFPLSQGALKDATHWLSDQGITERDLVIGLNPGGGWEIKRWRPDSFSEIADRLMNDYGARILLIWGPGERDLVDEVAENMKHSPLFLPETSLQGLGAYLTKCKLLLSNDSGPMHIAAALNVPAIGIFGPTDPNLQGPYGEQNMAIQNLDLDCLCCNRLTCKIGNLCMTDLSTDIVYSEIVRYLNPA